MTLRTSVLRARLIMDHGFSDEVADEVCDAVQEWIEEGADEY